MLIDFSVENYRSFKDRVTFSMVASNAKGEDPNTDQNVIRNAQGSGLDLLKTATIYGANASGKSNLLSSMFFVGDFILKSAKESLKGEDIPVDPFRLDQNCWSMPSTFEINFLMDSIRYKYGFSTDKNIVHKEWLYSYPLKQARKIFTREYNKKKKNYIFKKTDWRGEWERLKKVTRSNALFLSVATQWNHELSGQIVKWFHVYFRSISSNPVLGPVYNFTNSLVEKDEAFKNFLLKALNRADYGISNINIEKRTLDDVSQILLVVDTKGENDASNTDIKKSYPIPVTEHIGIGTRGNVLENIPFEFSEESDGTQKFYVLSGPIFYTISNGSVLIADELDSRLHPQLVRWIVELFNNEITNQKSAQLIFATHQDNLLDKTLFRRDQVWFMEKDNQGATKLYSLWDIRPRNNEDIRKRYLQGRYGAVPMLSDLDD